MTVTHTLIIPQFCWTQGFSTPPHGDAEASRQLDNFIRHAEIEIASITPEQAQIARQAYQDFGKGRHKAGLNFGDCFAYALARATGEPLLFKGNDFANTDIIPYANSAS